MKTYSIITGYDRPGKKDATHAFLPEAKAFRDLHGGGKLIFQDHMPMGRRRRCTEDVITGSLWGVPLETLAFFGHGTKTQLVCTGHRLVDILQLRNAILSAMGCEMWEGPAAPTRTILFYSCLTGNGSTGFADVLADLMPYVHVYAHDTSGHTTWNPYKELAGGPNGGNRIVGTKDQLWPRWRERLREDQDFRLSFWKHGVGKPRLKAIEAIREEVSK